MTEINDIFFEHRTTQINFAGQSSWTQTKLTTMEIEATEKLDVPASLNILIIGGTGFIGTALTAEALKANHHVVVVARGNLPTPNGATLIKADRKIPGNLENALCHTTVKFDLVVDCIADDDNDIAQDIKLFSCNCGRLVALSSDLVFDPQKRTFPQDEFCEGFVNDKSIVGAWRKAELALFNASHYYTNWTILRPCHVYGHNRLCGPSIPPFKTDADLRQLIADGANLNLPGGGHFLIQPIFIDDLARMILSCPYSQESMGKAITCAGPDVVELAGYYKAIAAAMDSSVNIVETSIADQLAATPAMAPYFCHRIYSRNAIKSANLPMPITSLGDGIAVSL